MGENEDGDSLDHEIAVESREADKTRLSVGDATARTSDEWFDNVAESL